MAQQALSTAETTAPEKRRPGNPNWRPGISGNPNGRKKRGQTWAELMRSTVDREEAVKQLAAVACGKRGSPSDQVNALKLILSYVEPPMPDHLVSVGVHVDNSFDLSKLTVEELLQLRRLKEKACSQEGAAVELRATPVMKAPAHEPESEPEVEEEQDAEAAPSRMLAPVEILKPREREERF